MSRVPLVVPDLGLPDETIKANCWLAARGDNVVEGDRLLELAAGEVTIDVPAPATGRLAEKSVREGDSVSSHQPLGIIETGEGENQ